MKSKNLLSLTKAIESALAQMSEYCEAAALDAKQRRIRYDALMTEGFTADQALELVKHGF